MYYIYLLISGDPNGVVYPKTPVRESLVMSPMASSAATVTLPRVTIAPHKLDTQVEAHQIKMTAISASYKATESTSSTIVTSAQLAGSSSTATVGVSPDHNKYLHKKFKRIASTTLEPHAPSTHSVPGRQPQFQNQHLGQGQKTLPNGQHIDENNRIKDVPIPHTFNNHYSHSTRQDYAPNSTTVPTTNAVSRGMSLNEGTEANATVKANTPQSSPTMQKTNHLNNNNNYSSQHNNNNHIAPPQHQPSQFLQNGTASTSISYSPTMISKPLEQQRQFYYIHSSSPNPQDGQNVVRRLTPEPNVFVDGQQHQRLQPQTQPQFFPISVSTTERTISPSIATQQPPQQPSSSDSPTPGRYVCPFCQLNCAKPSVLQKHIRAHTNERPYPCEPCGFAFKTRSNLYKHRR